MTNLQLYLAIGVPLIGNFLMLTLGFITSNARLTDMGVRFSDLRQDLHDRLTAMETTWRAELHRVEEVIDARLKTLEGK